MPRILDQFIQLWTEIFGALAFQHGCFTPSDEALLGRYRVRVYVSYGPSWYPWFMRRLAERPANIGFFLRHLFG